MDSDGLGGSEVTRGSGLGLNTLAAGLDTGGAFRGEELVGKTRDEVVGFIFDITPLSSRKNGAEFACPVFESYAGL